MSMQSFRTQQELAQHLAQNLYKMCEELDYLMEVIGQQINLLPPFEELHKNYIFVYQHLKIATINLVNEVIANHIKYLEEQQELLGEAIKVQQNRGIPFLQEEMKIILESMRSHS